MTKIIYIRLELDCDNISTYQQSDGFIENDIDTELNCCSNYYRKTCFYTNTDAEIQKMQDMESAEIEKVYQLGYEEGKKDAQPEPIKVSVDREMTEEELKELKKKIADSPVVLLPSAQRKKGKWIKLDMHAHLADHKCTACGQECYVPTCMGEPMYTYCPNCGADMRGEQDG